MSDIDHAAKALHFIDDSWVETDELRAAKAQVHATLALVAATEKVAEQARIANLVEYLKIASVHRGGYDDSTKALEKRVREGLGL